jgi:uncharacterized repeat protein (TIGR03803 family)
VLWSLGNGTDGRSPSAGLINVNGTLYDTTYNGGAYGYGVVFSLNPGTNGEAALWSFGNGSDGQNPNRSLVNVNGTLYGTTIFGGTNGDRGTVFSLNPQTNAEAVLWSFGNAAPGQYSESSLISVKGTPYGTTFFGGTYGGGTVLSIVP